MLTGRGGALLLLAFALWSFGVIAGAMSLALVGSALLIWFFLAWLVFVFRVRLILPRLRLTRVLCDEHGRVESLWASTPYRVALEIRNESRLALPHAVVIDRLPLLAANVRGRYDASGPIESGQSLSIDYTLQAAGAGTLRFEGVKLLVSDLQGLFATPFFLRQPLAARVLTPLADARGHVPAVKRLNILPLLGHHPHRRPGSGIELLDLRDYLPGDPPKLIAWKISARRDRLMIRELESEVPIRCTLFVDTSDAVRVGAPGRTPLSRLTEIASAVAQANAASRDLTGVCLFDDRGVVRMVRPDRGRRHLLKLVHLLADHADLLPTASQAVLSRLLVEACGLAQDLYPEAMRPPWNSFPWWLPAWSPQPHYTLPRRGAAPRSRAARAFHWLERRLAETPLGWLLSMPRRFAPTAYRLYRQRKQIAALIAARGSAGPEEMTRLLEDDEACRDALVRFLAEHHAPAPMRYFDDEGRYAFASPRKPAVLARALLAALRRGRDNELFVLLVDLLENEDADALLRAIRVARAKHHQVMLVCPWPDDVPLPGAAPALAGLLETRDNVEELLRLTTIWRLHQAYHRLAGTLARAGVKVLCARQRDAAPLILQRMRRLRALQRGVS